MIFFAEGIPRQQGNHRINPNTHTLYESTKGHGQWREVVGWSAVAAKVPRIEGAVELRLLFVMPRTKALGSALWVPHTKPPDLDKLKRSVFDALTGIGYRGDEQITGCESWKRYANPNESTGVWVDIGVADGVKMSL